jgi:hypothetical protein
MRDKTQAGSASRALVAAALLTALLLVGGLQISAQAASLGPAEHVLANRPPVTPAVTFDGPDFALLATSHTASPPAVSEGLVVHPVAAPEPWLGRFPRYIRPPPFA